MTHFFFYTVKNETSVHQNGELPSLGHSTDEPDSAVVKSDSQPVEAPVISDIPESTLQKDSIKKRKEEKVKLFAKLFKKKAGLPVDGQSVQRNENEDQTDVGPPAAEPQPVSRTFFNRNPCDSHLLNNQCGQTDAKSTLGQTTC